MVSRQSPNKKEISRNWKIGKAQFLCITRLFAQVLWFFIENYQSAWNSRISTIKQASRLHRTKDLWAFFNLRDYL